MLTTVIDITGTFSVKAHASASILLKTNLIRDDMREDITTKNNKAKLKCAFCYIQVLFCDTWFYVVNIVFLK